MLSSWHESSQAGVKQSLASANSIDQLSSGVLLCPFEGALPVTY